MNWFCVFQINNKNQVVTPWPPNAIIFVLRYQVYIAIRSAKLSVIKAFNFRSTKFVYPVLL